MFSFTFNFAERKFVQKELLKVDSKMLPLIKLGKNDQLFKKSNVIESGLS